MRSVYNFGSFGGVGRQSTDVALLKDEQPHLEEQEAEANGRDGPKGYVGHQRRRRVSIAKTLALIGLVLVTLSGVILTAIGGVVSRWTPSGLWGQEKEMVTGTATSGLWGQGKEMVMGTATAPSTPPATSRVDDATSVDDAKFANITSNNKNGKIEDFFPEGFIESVLAYHGYIEKTGEEEEEQEMKPKKLNKRVPPHGHGCGDSDNWRGRECDEPTDERAYIEYCYDENSIQPEVLVATRRWCRDGTYCSAYTGADDYPHIMCKIKKYSKKDNLRKAGAASTRSNQFGWRGISCLDGCTRQVYQSVKLLADIPLASFSALFVDSTASYVFATENEMNANVFGSDIKLCRSGFALDVGGRGCKPKTLWHFRKDNIVSINFGKALQQTGILFYNIVGN